MSRHVGSNIDPSPVQEAVLRAFALFVDEYGYAPTVGELAKLTGLSEGNVRNRVRQLVRKGWLYRAAPRVWRNLRVARSLDELRKG